MRFTLRDVFWFTLLVALLLVWWREGLILDSEKRTLENEIRYASSARDAAIKKLRRTDPYFVAAGWRTWAEPDDHDLGLDSKVRHGGEYSAFIKSKHSSAESCALLYQTVRADEYVGKRVRLSGQIRAEIDKPHPYLSASFFLAAKPGGKEPINAYCDQPLPNSADWQQFDVVLDIPRDAALITFGVAAPAGTTWIDDLQLEIVGPEVPSTELSLSYLGPLEELRGPGSLTYPTMPLSLDFELPVPSQRTAKAGD